eukprot:397667-Rhodomonas_salina.3
MWRCLCRCCSTSSSSSSPCGTSRTLCGATATWRRRSARPCSPRAGASASAHVRAELVSTMMTAVLSHRMRSARASYGFSTRIAWHEPSTKLA